MNAISTLKTDYTQEPTLREALVLAAKVLGKSMDTATPDPNKFEIAVVTRDESGQVVQRRIEGEELSKILDEAKVLEGNKK